jgi:signal transduction histidine kinase
MLEWSPGEEGCLEAMRRWEVMLDEGDRHLQFIRAQAAAQERETLLRQIVHDVLNATQTMSLLVEELEIQGHDPDTLRHGCGRLHQQIDFIGRFLREKLNWIHTDGQSVGVGCTAVVEAFAELEARYAASARVRRQQLVFDAPEPVTVLINPVEFDQAIGNLIDNAIKYTDTGGTITVRAESVRGWATIWVIDSGTGIAPVNRHRLGDLGWRESPHGQGLGVGLVTVREVVTRSGGLFGLAQSNSSGSSFYVSLPTTTWGQARHN